MAFYVAGLAPVPRKRINGIGADEASNARDFQSHSEIGSMFFVAGVIGDGMMGGAEETSIPPLYAEVQT